MVQPFQNHGSFLKCETLAQDPAILFLGISPREMRAHAHRKTRTWNVLSSIIPNNQEVGTAPNACQLAIR